MAEVVHKHLEEKRIFFVLFLIFSESFPMSVSEEFSVLISHLRWSTTLMSYVDSQYHSQTLTQSHRVLLQARILWPH